MYNPNIIENPGIVEYENIIAIPPGESIKELLYYRNMSQKEFALRMQFSEKHVSKLINGEVLLTTDTAVKLETILGPPVHFWEGLESNYRECLLRIEEEKNITSESDIIELLPYSLMLSNGWVPEAKTVYEKVLNSRKFFEVLSLHMIFDPRLNKLSSFHEEKENEAIFLAWAQKAKLEARNIETKSFNIKKLNKTIPELKALCLSPKSKFIPALQEKLSECGVALVILPPLGVTFMHGATINDNGKVIIGLTIEGKTNDQFWLSLFHELGHIVNGDINLKTECESDFESKADQFALDYFINLNDYSIFIEQNNFTKSSIKKFAAYAKICDSLVVSRLQSDGKISSSDFNELKQKL